MRRAFVVLAALVIPGAGLVLWHLYAPRVTASPQPPLAHLTAETFGSFVEAFNASADRTRVLVMLSPT